MSDKVWVTPVGAMRSHLFDIEGDSLCGLWFYAFVRPAAVQRPPCKECERKSK